MCARADPPRERVCCSHFLEMKGSAQDALQGLPITAPLELAAIQDTRSLSSPDRSISRARHRESSNLASIILQSTAFLHSPVSFDTMALGTWLILVA
jgi:hypothetical protein